MNKAFDGPGLIPATVAFSSERSHTSNRPLSSAVCRTVSSAQISGPAGLPACPQRDNHRTPVVTPADLTLERTSIRAAVETLNARRHAAHHSIPQTGEQKTATTFPYQRCGWSAHANSFGVMTLKLGIRG